MVKILQDLWIMTQNGVVLYSRVFDQTIDDQLFGGLMSALNSFAEEITDGGLTNFDMSKKRFCIMKKNEILFIANSTPKIKPKKLMEEIKKIVERFFNRYSERFLEYWDNDITMFQDFGESIEDTLEEPMKQFWKGF